MQLHTSFIICATPRSGSTMFAEALTLTGLAGQPEEFFCTRTETRLVKLWGTVDLAGFLKMLLKRTSSPNGVFGFKIMYANVIELFTRLRQIPDYSDPQCSDCELLSNLFPNLHYIWLTRRNKVRQAVSYYKAGATGAWTSSMVVAPPIEEPVYDFEAIDENVQELVMDEVEWQEFFTRFKITPLTVVYEDLVENYEETILRVLEFLKIAIPPDKDLGFDERWQEKQANTLSDEWVRRYCQEKLMKIYGKRSSDFSLYLGR